jgi:endonuclease/exonuclease/phosphatase family metal-dependent hydrolase
MRAMNADIWAVQEVVDAEALRRLGSELGGYDVLVSSDAEVTSGSDVYGPNGMKLGVVYRPERVERVAARVVLTSDLDPFNGRAPLEVELSTKPGGTSITLVVIHLSPGTDEASYTKRKTAAALLKEHVDAKADGTLLMVAGDFNDGLAASSFNGQESPFSAFLDDNAYAFVTLGLKSPRYPRVIDHQLVTDDLASAFMKGTAKVVDGDTLVDGYVDTTSDHDPVVATYELP